jgi:hypothetical protein
VHDTVHADSIAPALQPASAIDVSRAMNDPDVSGFRKLLLLAQLPDEFALRIWTGSLVSLGIAVKERDVRTAYGFPELDKPGQF